MKFQNFSIAKIEFLWRALNFKRGHGHPGPPFSAAYEFCNPAYKYPCFVLEFSSNIIL